MTKQDFYTLTIGQTIILNGEEKIIDQLRDVPGGFVSFKNSTFSIFWKHDHDKCSLPKSKLAVTCKECGYKQLEYSEICCRCGEFL